MSMTDWSTETLRSFRSIYVDTRERISAGMPSGKPWRRWEERALFSILFKEVLVCWQCSAVQCNLPTLLVGVLRLVNYSYLKFIWRCCQKMRWLVHTGRELNEREWLWMTNLELTPWSSVLLKESPVAQILKNLSIFYGTPKFNYKNSPLFPILGRMNPIHTIPYRSSYYNTTYVLVFQVVSLPLAFPPTCYIHTWSPHGCYMPCPSHAPWLDDSNSIWRRVQFMKLLITHLSPTSYRSKYSP
jgi:hypothetical protein